MQVSHHICRTSCWIYASSTSGKSYNLSSDNELTCSGNNITFTASNSNATDTALPINDIYFAKIQVGNAAGIGYSEGDIRISESMYTIATL